LRSTDKQKNWQVWRGWLGYSGAMSFIPRAGFSGVFMVAYLPSEYREPEVACGLAADSGAYVRAIKAMLGRQNSVSLY